jgi:hypothetical protein
MGSSDTVSVITAQLTSATKHRLVNTRPPSSCLLPLIPENE